MDVGVRLQLRISRKTRRLINKMEGDIEGGEGREEHVNSREYNSREWKGKEQSTFLNIAAGITPLRGIFVVVGKFFIFVILQGFFGGEVKNKGQGKTKSPPSCLPSTSILLLLTTIIYKHVAPLPPPLSFSSSSSSSRPPIRRRWCWWLLVLVLLLLLLLVLGGPPPSSSTLPLPFLLLLLLHNPLHKL